jgi:hypothetical protein
MEALEALDGYYVLRAMAPPGTVVTELPIRARHAVFELTAAMAKGADAVVEVSVIKALGVDEDVDGRVPISAQIGLQLLAAASSTRPLAGDALHAIAAVELPGKSVRADPGFKVRHYIVKMFGRKCIRYCIETSEESVIWFRDDCAPDTPGMVQKMVDSMVAHAKNRNCAPADTVGTFAGLVARACRAAMEKNE